MPGEITRSTLGEGRPRSSRLNWQDITKAGAYVSESTGLLYRIPQEAILQGASPVLKVEDNGGFVRVDSNPYVHLSTAAMRALEEGITPQFAS